MNQRWAKAKLEKRRLATQSRQSGSPSIQTSRPCKNCGRDRRKNKIFCCVSCYESFQKRPKTTQELAEIKLAKSEKFRRKRQARGQREFELNPTRFTYYHHVYLNSDRWGELRKLKLQERDCCANCSSRTKLHVHHWDYHNLTDVLLIDLEVVCELCHNEIHRRIDRFPKSEWTRLRDLFRELGMDGLPINPKHH
jgi:hypothetical protein